MPSPGGWSFATRVSMPRSSLEKVQPLSGAVATRAWSLQRLRFLGSGCTIVISMCYELRLEINPTVLSCFNQW
jgi:hypothetical protein